MPTPVGHAIGGLATAWFLASATLKNTHPHRIALGCAVAATLPDLDIFLNAHRTYSHSVTAVAIVGFIAWMTLRRRSPYAVRIALMVAAAYASHLLLDWLGKDSANPAGLMVLWPFSTRFHLSGVDLFQEVSRRYWNPDEFILGNLRALGREMLILGPVAGIAWWLNGRWSMVGGR